MKANGIILAGGESLRMKADKRLAKIGNQSLIERSISLVSQVVDEVIVVSPSDMVLSFIANNRNVRITSDIYPNQGPLAGIHAGLSASNTSSNLVVACDMPFLQLDLLRYMLQISSGFDAVVPCICGLVEPLHAIYNKSCLELIENQLRSKRGKISNLLWLLQVRYLEPEEIKRFDPELISFFNINNAEDLIRARELTEAKKIKSYKKSPR